MSIQIQIVEELKAIKTINKKVFAKNAKVWNISSYKFIGEAIKIFKYN